MTELKDRSIENFYDSTVRKIQVCDFTKFLPAEMAEESLVKSLT